MSHLQQSRSEGVEGADYYNPQHPLRDALVQRKSQIQPLGVLLVCKHSSTWQQAPLEERHPFDFDNSQILKSWEEKFEGRIYRIYGYGEGEKGPWEFFILLEFEDLQAWNHLQEKLDRTGFSDYFEWEIIAFGRRAGS